MWKEWSMNADLSSVNQVFNMTTIMSGNFNTNCDAPDHLTTHTSVISLQAWIISALNSIIVCSFLEKPIP
jgi:hypothetical protein